MSNYLFNQLSNQSQYGEMIKQFNNFRNAFRGDARSQVQHMLNSGKITQSQYNEAVQKANALAQILGIK